MTEPSPIFDIRKILVALDTSPHSLAALDAAVNLAAKMNAELLGIFVEDTELLRLAEIPCAREILYFSKAESPLSRARMESRLRAQSERARKALAAAARRAQVEWSFQTVRGEVTTEVAAAASKADLLAMGKGGWSLSRKSRTGSTALELSTSSIPVLLLPESGLSPNAPLVVYYDGSPAAKRGLLCAMRLEEAGMDGVIVLLLAANEEQARILQEEIERLAPRDAHKPQCHRLDAHNEPSLLQALVAQEEGMLVLGSREFLKKLPHLDELLSVTKMSLLLLADAPEDRIQ